MLLLYMQAAREMGHSPVLVTAADGWLTQRCAQQGFPVEYAPLLPDVSARGWYAQFAHWFENARVIHNVIKKYSATLVHCNKIQAVYAGGLGGWMAGVRVIAHLHDVTSLEHSGGVKLRLLEALSHHVICVSQAVRIHLKSVAPWFGVPITTIHNGLPPLDTPPDKAIAFDERLIGLPAWAWVIGCIAPINPLKGQLVLLEAFEQMIADGRAQNAMLMLVGDSQGVEEYEIYEQELKDYVLDHNLVHRVFFTGWVADPDPYYAMCEVFVHCPTRFDALPTSLLNAARMGLACVATCIGGIPEIIEDGRSGLLVDPGDDEQLTDVLCSLYNDRETRLKLGAALKERYRVSYSYDVMKLAISALYEKVLKP